ncbi:hypothetical protein N9R04_00735 [Staphylococcus sp. SQ8-PEA]|uniref:Integral membrane protein n=1 Tax=Staphylococcus marylandisciuri TaxID=2981529 RepID=A0ABT2QMP7_9STAP|nr:hypothetical protein [Staphylococcus marylandisciuri]MCU5745245.1 hypothetical protein [Staphylococcus marylandisciuri]
MDNRQAYHQNFERTLSQEELHRGHRIGKKRRSWVSLIIHIIVLVLTAISGYSIFKEPLFNLQFLHKPVNFGQLSEFKDNLHNISQMDELKNLPINLNNLEEFQTNLNHLITLFYVFFALCAISLILTLFTIAFNRTILKILNFILVAAMLVMTFGFSYLVDDVASQIAKKFSSAYLSVKPDQILTQADAVHNALILLGCSLALIFISFFFRNKRRKVF